MSDFKQRIDVNSQTLRIEECSFQEPGFDTEPFLERQTRNTPVQRLKNSREKTEFQEINTNTDMTAIYNGDDNVSPTKITTSETEERRVSDGDANEFNLPLSSTKVLKLKRNPVCATEFQQRHLNRCPS